MWVKTSDAYPDRCAAVDLSDAAYRTHHEAISWVMRRENGPLISKRDVDRFAESPMADAAVVELLDAGFWRPAAGGYEVVMGMEHQPEPEVIEARRMADAERQRRSRRKRAGLPDDLASQRDNTRDSRRDNTRDSGRGGTGRGGSGTSTTKDALEEGRISRNGGALEDEPPW